MPYEIQFVTVAVPGPMRRAFTYSRPEEARDLSPGQRVLVPFGRTRKVGFYLGPSAPPPPDVNAKAILKILDTQSQFPPDLFALCRWMADYYFANPADCLAAALPPTLKGNLAPSFAFSERLPDFLPPDLKRIARPGKRLSSDTLTTLRKSDPQLWKKLTEEGGVVEHWPDDNSVARQRLVGYTADFDKNWSALFDPESIPRRRFEGVKTSAELIALGWTNHYVRKAVKMSLLSPVFGEPDVKIFQSVAARPEVATIALNPEQQAAVDAVKSSLGSGFGVFLLHGITGSGKTLVYCHLAREVVNAGQTALVLTPEISLTGPTLAYFRGFFGDQVTVIHSAMTARERFESWQGIRRGKYRIVIGPRSALFAPMPRLGLIVVDEEHDGSYKQDDPSPRFHGRDGAIMRAKIGRIPVLLGSATPSLESYYHARSGRYRLLELTQRPGEATLPVVRIVDMRGEGVGGDLQFVSITLKKEVQKRLEIDEQVILYLNRRGYAPQLKCAECGYVPQCPQCQVRLTYHKVGSKLSCHYCDYRTHSYHACDRCHGTHFLFQGTGTQRVEESIPRLFDRARPVRLDSDSASGRQGAYRILSDFATGKHNLLLGTQMVTKGLDLPNVSLVGVLSADLGAELPDFRAPEKTFARLVQVAGRSGRADRKGEVLIQTFSPESDLIADAARQDYRSFYDREIASRRSGRYPPFVRIINFIFSGPDEKKLESSARQFRTELLRHIEAGKIEASILGPAPCALYRLRRRYRRHLFVRTNQSVRFVRMLSEWEEREPHFGLGRTSRIVVDVDPDDMM